MVETVGVGQAEVDIADAAHTTVVVEAPGMGDGVQTIKAGILEIADILVVNKADRPEALRTVKALEMMLHMGQIGHVGHHGQLAQFEAIPAGGLASEWRLDVLQTVATEGKGIPAANRSPSGAQDFSFSQAVNGWSGKTSAAGRNWNDCCEIVL